MNEVAITSGLEIHSLVVARGTKIVVHGIDMRIQPACITALMGANGAGKTSTILALCGAINPTSGDIVLEGRNMLGLGADAIRRLGMATVPEGHQVLRELTVLDNLRAAGGDLSERQLDSAIKLQLALFPELSERLRARARDLSGGQQQMVALAQAMIGPPKYLLIDELSFGLAPAVVMRLIPIIKRIAASGVGILLVEQFTTLSLALAGHVYVMSRGEISYDGLPAMLRTNPEILHRAYFPVESAASA